LCGCLCGASNILLVGVAARSLAAAEVDVSLPGLGAGHALRLIAFVHVREAALHLDSQDAYGKENRESKSISTPENRVKSSPGSPVVSLTDQRT